MEIITSNSNTYVKFLRSLKNAKPRKESGMFLAEGTLCAKEALDFGFAECVISSCENDIVIQAEAKGIRTILLTNTVFESVSSEKTPQGVAAVCRIKDSLIPMQQNIVVLEDVTDPQNVGTIIRTADAAGFGGVILSDGCADYTSPRAVRASMGSIFHLPIESGNIFKILEERKCAGTAVIAGHLRGNDKLTPVNPCAVLVGNETRGLSNDASDMADILYKIPIRGKAESLNVAVAAGILMYKSMGEI